MARQRARIDTQAIKADPLAVTEPQGDLSTSRQGDKATEPQGDTAPKVKATFYLPQDVAEALELAHAQARIAASRDPNRGAPSRSDLVTEALRAWLARE